MNRNRSKLTKPSIIKGTRITDYQGNLMKFLFNELLNNTLNFNDDYCDIYC